MSKPTTKNDEILAAMKARFLAITATDYHYSYTKKVFLESASPEKEGIFISSQDEQIEELESSLTLHDVTMQIDIDLVAANASMEVGKMEADVLKSISTDITWGSLAHWTKHLNTTRNPQDQQGNQISDKRISLEVRFRKNAFSV